MPSVAHTLVNSASWRTHRILQGYILKQRNAIRLLECAYNSGFWNMFRMQLLKYSFGKIHSIGQGQPKVDKWFITGMMIIYICFDGIWAEKGAHIWKETVFWRYSIDSLHFSFNTIVISFCLPSDVWKFEGLVFAADNWVSRPTAKLALVKFGYRVK